MAQIRTLPLLFVLTLLAACGGGGGGASAPATAAGTPPPASTAPVLSKLSGTVLDKSARPVAGVTISVFHHNTNTTVTTLTDANGAWSVAGNDTVRNADYAIYAAKTGYGFVPSVGDSAGAVGRLDFWGLYRTVIRFLALPAHDVNSVNFTAFGAGDRAVSLARTGQTASYASGDDGAARVGVAWPGTRFTDHGNGTVTDHLTGLVWLKNAGCFSPSSWSAAISAARALASGACGLTDGSAAGTWRMPNVNELESLVDIARANPALSAAHPFQGVGLASAYWSSTTYTALTGNAMAIRFSDGRWINGIDSADGSFSNSKGSALNLLWAVKSGAPGTVSLLATGVYDSQGGGSFGINDDASLQLGATLPTPRFIDKGDGTVTDTATGLVWLKQADCVKQSWSGALAGIRSLASGSCGLTDGSTAGQWRMPNRSEMLSLSDRAPTFPQASYFNGQYQASTTTTGAVIFTNFAINEFYWTSSTDAADTQQAWTLYSCDFGVYNIAKSEVKYTLAVR